MATEIQVRVPEQVSGNEVTGDEVTARFDQDEEDLLPSVCLSSFLVSLFWLFLQEMALGQLL